MPRLSNSAINKYLSCPKSYDYHYNQKLRDPTKSAALLFGDAMDNALNALLKGKNVDPLDVFNQKWEVNKVQGDEYEDIPENLFVRYAESDFDKDLLQEEDLLYIKTKYMETGYTHENPMDLYKEILEVKKSLGYDQLTQDQIRIFNLMNWFSLKRKAAPMIEAYKKVVVPRIHKVHDVQKYIALENNEGDSVIGYIDMIVDVIKDDGEIVTAIADNKTSSIDYSRDSVVKSQQLTIYGLAENINYGAYFVLKKQIQKNKKKVCKKCGYDGIKKETNKLTTAKTCDNVLSDGARCHGEWTETISPEARVDIIIDELRPRTKEIVSEVLEEVNKAIKANIYPRNFQACDNWGGCPYKKLCFYGSEKGLIKK